MILYFDSYITDEPLQNKWPELRRIEARVRAGCRAYRTQTKLEIAKYTLASYAPVNWSHVVIKHELQDPSQVPAFDEYVRGLFPYAHIIHNRSATQREYIESVELLESLGDEWIFYAPNNDHVMVSPDPTICDPLLATAKRLRSERGQHVSICYSHFPEVNASGRASHLVNRVYCPDAQLIDETSTSVAQYYPNGLLDGIQIVHTELLREWFAGQNCGDARIIRPESLAPYIKPPAQIVVKPRTEICRHYDGYMHTMYWGRLVYLPPEVVPPLFIPDGYFDGTIRIAYGFDAYREGWVNVNATKASYRFADPLEGTDLMCALEDLPAFWQGAIAEVDVNPAADPAALRAAEAQQRARLADPWREIPKLKVDAFFAYRRLAQSLPWLRKIPTLFKDSRRFA